MAGIKSNSEAFKLTEGNGGVRKAATIAVKDKQAEGESKGPLPENFSVKDINIVHVRTLSVLI